MCLCQYFLNRVNLDSPLDDGGPRDMSTFRICKFTLSLSLSEDVLEVISHSRTITHRAKNTRRINLPDVCIGSYKTVDLETFQTEGQIDLIFAIKISK